MTETAANPADVRRAAMDLLARREHSLQELRQKLSRRFSDAELVNQQLMLLAEENLQSDVRFAESFARLRVSRGQGPVRIRQELRLRGLSNMVVDAALETLEVDWLELARTVHRRKFNGPAEDHRQRARHYRFLLQRGFDSDICRLVTADN